MPKNKELNFGQVNLGRDAIFGDQYNHFVLQMGAFKPPKEHSELRRNYLDHIERAYHALDFKGIPQLRTLPSELSLESVYVPIMARPELPEGEAWDRRLAGRNFADDSLPEESMGHIGISVPEQIEGALGEKTRVVVVGDPGSGKSTMLKYLTLRLSKDPNAPLPILMPLNAYARALKIKNINLQNYLAEYFAGRAEGVAELGTLFREALESGKAVILLDGLDEVQDNRAALVEKVEAFAGEAVKYGNRVLVTSRIVGYRDAALEPKDWALYTLLDFTPEAIESFAKKWCLTMEISTLGDTPEARKQAEIERAGLLEAIQANPGVARLASNPLLLTILALIKRQGVELPKSRIKLYDRYLETLIEAWNRASALDKSAGHKSLDYDSTLEVLGPLALRIRQENPTAGLVNARQLKDWLTEHYTGEQWGLKQGPAREKAHEFLESVRRHSNLLVERGDGQYGFIHLTFEEALAAYGLVAAGQVDRQKTLTYIQKHISDPAWRETILLSVGVLGLIQHTPQAAGQVVRAILNMNYDNKSPGGNLLLAGACLEDVGSVGLGQVATRDVQAALLTACCNRSLPPALQRDAGLSLAQSGWVPTDMDNSWVDIPAGEFLYGDNKQKEIIEVPFAIQKYPITNLQFKNFLLDHGYEREELWSKDGWAWRTGQIDIKVTDNLLKDILNSRLHEKRDEPFFWHDKKWNNQLAPVVGISWFEAEAYANWVSKLSGKSMRLPTGLEWERAARGSEGREYAWGNTFDKNNSNTAPFWKQDDEARYAFDLDDAATTIVCQFPEGNTPEDIFDLSGNVWEWTNSWYEKEQVNRIVRGGSWNYGFWIARCASSLKHFPCYASNSVGFRLVFPKC